jgi:hypothetical protein
VLAFVRFAYTAEDSHAALDAGELGYFPPKEYARITPCGFEALVGAPAPTISIVFVRAGNELTPAGAFVDQSTEPSFVESA